ncbi:hypothetical protein [Sphingomonas bacterium]|uniref:hypothetical protein n=1 Tax=Sphingomonas bacterium TaxID=1895847 RepID=UPI0015757ABC|nr:hypothetical protein [Sphingomonas bacterium]
MSVTDSARHANGHRARPRGRRIAGRLGASLFAAVLALALPAGAARAQTSPPGPPA